MVQLERFEVLVPDIPGQNLALTVLDVPYSLEKLALAVLYMPYSYICHVRGFFVTPVNPQQVDGEVGKEAR